MQNNPLITIDLSSITPADYNPRLLPEDAANRLKESLTKLGIIKAIIINNDNNVIVAGHQRTKTMLDLGIKEAPAFKIKGVTKQGEVRFNQFHNRCEYEYSKDAPKVRVKGELKKGWNLISWRDIIIEDRGKKAQENKLLANLMIKYGTFGNSICTMDGSVFISSGYALVSRLCNVDLYVYAVDAEQEKLCRYYFSKDYGVYSYDNIKRETYVQSLAQLHRIPTKGKERRSKLYVTHIIPHLDSELKGKSMLDFGAGEYDYAELLKSKGVDIDFVDPYHCKGIGFIDAKGNSEKFIAISKRIAEHGLYDVVICDSVLNSVDSLEARQSVILTCYGLCKDGGKLYISGRMEPASPKGKTGLEKKSRNTIYFPDKDGFTATMRDGHWFFQKFDTQAQIKDIVDLLGNGQIYKAGSSWQIAVTKKWREELVEPVVNALKFEWNLPLPNGKRYELSEHIERSYRARLAADSAV